VGVLYNSTKITYDNISINDLGCISARIENINTEDIYVSDREIQQDSSGRNWGSKSKNYLYKVQRKPHEFKLELAFEILNDDIAREVAKLFFQDRFLPLVADDVFRVYFCMPTGSTINYLGNGGYLTFTMRTFDEYSYSPSTVTTVKDYSGNVSTTLQINVSGDVIIYPEITITPNVSGSALKITNLSNEGKFMQFETDGKGNQLIATEVITIDCENEIVSTDQLALYRYDNLTTDSDYLELVSGVNNIQIDGDMLLTVKYRNKYLF